MNIILGILITATSYLIYPFLKFKVICKNKKYTSDRIHIELIINSVIICIIYLILQRILTGKISVINFTPALVYYYINVGLYKNVGEKQKEIKSDIEISKKSKANSINEVKEEKIKIKEEKNSQINNTNNTEQVDILEANIHQNDETKVENENNTFLKTLSIILGIFLLIAIIIIFSLLIRNEKQRLEIIDLKEEYSDYDKLMEYKYLYFDEMAKNVKLSDKAEFMDEHIVFILDGYGKYYYNYDCMREVTQGKKFSFIAYNTENAIRLGYKKFSCN